MIFLKKVSQGARFFTVVLACTRSLKNAYTNCVLEFPFLAAFKLPSFGLMDFIDMDTYLLTEDTNFKVVLKENYAIVLDSWWTFLLDIFELYSRFDEYLAI